MHQIPIESLCSCIHVHRYEPVRCVTTFAWLCFRRYCWINSLLLTLVVLLLQSLLLLWFIVSGWAFRVFFFSLWFLPFAGPLLIGTLSKAAVVEVSFMPFLYMFG